MQTVSVIVYAFAYRSSRDIDTEIETNRYRYNFYWYMIVNFKDFIRTLTSSFPFFKLNFNENKGEKIYRTGIQDNYYRSVHLHVFKKDKIYGQNKGWTVATHSKIFFH